MLTKLFQRKTQSTSFIPEIDGLRFFAIITVIIFHINTAYARTLGYDDLAMNTLGGERTLFSPAWWIVRLDLGVKVFFSISGMVLALPFIKNLLTNRKPILISEYFYRRLTRLEPPFIISLIGFFIVHIFVMNEEFLPMIPHFFAGLFYLHQLIYGVPNPINPVTWSLETEAQFYLIVPAIFALIYRWKSLWIRLFFIGTMVSGSIYFKMFAYGADLIWLKASIPYYLTNFATGVIFAWYYVKYESRFKHRNIWWDVIGILSIIGLFIFYKPQFTMINNIMFNLASFGMMSAVFKGKLMNWLFTRPIIYVIGGMCYSIYLLHYAFLHLLMKWTAGFTLNQGYLPDLGLQFLIAFPAVMIVSSVFYLLIEKPCMDKNWPKSLASWIQANVQRGKS